MKTTMVVGYSVSSTFTVTESMCPSFNDTVIHSICSTWDMAHQFEIAARKALEPHLEDGEQGIGSYISIEHLKPAPVGATVIVKATVVEIDESTVVCEIDASTNNHLCASGKQVQRVLPTSTIARIIEAATSQ